MFNRSKVNTRHNPAGCCWCQAHGFTATKAKHRAVAETFLITHWTDTARNAVQHTPLQQVQTQLIVVLAPQSPLLVSACKADTCGSLRKAAARQRCLHAQAHARQMPGHMPICHAWHIDVPHRRAVSRINTAHIAAMKHRTLTTHTCSCQA